MWRVCFPWLPKTLVTGERINPLFGVVLLVRRKENGGWVYRRATVEEAEEYLASRNSW